MINWKDISNLRLFKSLRLKNGATVVAESANGGATSVTATALVRGAAGLLSQAAPAAKTTTTTLTAAELLGGLLTANQGAAGAATYTLPLATDLETALLAVHPGLSADDAFDFSLVNISTVAGEDVTLATNTGWTLVGEMTVEANDADRAQSSGRFRVRRTAANAYTIYRIA